MSLICGCQASLSADANVNGNGASAEGDANIRAKTFEQAEGQGEMTRTSGATSAGAADASRVLLGARHDLQLRTSKATANCECLSVALGGSRSSGMVWSAVPPNIDESTQLSIALSSEGQACKGEPKGSLGASYWGYRITGNDVVVLVEAARGGRPLTNGAIIPKPAGPGQVFVAPASKKLPYGRSLEAGQGLCKVGNPGEPRKTAFTELEVGQKAPARSTEAGPSQAWDDLPSTIELPSN